MGRVGDGDCRNSPPELPSFGNPMERLIWSKLNKRSIANFLYRIRRRIGHSLRLCVEGQPGQTALTITTGNQRVRQ